MSDKLMENEGNLQKSGSVAVKESNVKKISSTATFTPNVVKKPTNLANVPQTQSDLEALNYTEFDTPAKMMALGTVLVKSQLVPLKRPEDVVTALMTGKELGLPFITSISQIYPINGRPTLGVHIQKALCLQRGVTFQKTEDAVAIYIFVATDAEGKVKIEDKKFIILGEGTFEEQPPNTKKKEITKRTTYEFSRLIKRPDGSWKEITAKGSFTLREAAEAELLDKDVWKKYWRRMLDARAFTNGVGEIADDITLGLRSPNELADNFYIDDSGKETFIEV
tara:strand:+ start:6063 stop:6902 length:840 start_codon:yes stop_codon:yes gene_type:complete